MNKKGELIIEIEISYRHSSYEKDHLNLTDRAKYYGF